MTRMPSSQRPRSDRFRSQPRSVGGDADGGLNRPRDVKALVHETVLALLGRRMDPVEMAEASGSSCRAPMRHVILHFPRRQVQIAASRSRPR